MATDLCLPVLKYSHATGQRSDGSLPWIHVTASDIFLLLKGAKANDEDLKMRVVQGSSVLESVDVGKYIDAAIHSRHRAEQAGVSPKADQLQIFGIARNSTVAVRYRQLDGQARRLQFRMKNLAECQRVASVLERRGLEFQEHKSSHSRQDTSRPSTSASQSRPLSMQSSSPFFELQPKPPYRANPFSQHTVEAGSLSSIRPSSSIRPPSQSHAFKTQPENTPRMMPPPPPIFSRDEVLMPREVEPNRPTTAQMYRSYTTPYHNSQYDMLEIEVQPSASSVQRPSSLSQTADLKSIRQAAAEYVSPPRSARMETHQPTSHGHLTLNDIPSSSYLNSALQHSDSTTSRPATGNLHAPSSTAIVDVLAHEIPQRQEISFVRPDSRASGSERSTTRPTSASLNLPPLPRPKSVRKDASPTKSDSTLVAQNVSPEDLSTKSPMKRPFDALSETPQVGISGGTEGNGVDTSASPSKALVASSVIAPPPKLSPMEKLLARNKPLLQRSPNAGVRRLDSLADAPHEIVSPPGTASSPTKSPANVATSHNTAPPAARESDPTTRTFDAVVSSIRNDVQKNLTDYAAQSQEDRQAAIDEFIIAHLEDPAFSRLCADVENSWRRFALGL